MRAGAQNVPDFGNPAGPTDRSTRGWRRVARTRIQPADSHPRSGCLQLARHSFPRYHSGKCRARGLSPHQHGNVPALKLPARNSPGAFSPADHFGIWISRLRSLHRGGPRPSRAARSFQALRRSPRCSGWRPGPGTEGRGRPRRRSAASRAEVGLGKRATALGEYCSTGISLVSVPARLAVVHLLLLSR
jgi:hypothetical protein